MKNNRILALSVEMIFSGGGLSADLATYTLNGLCVVVAVTCLTALTEKGFEVFPTDDTIFQHELDSLRLMEYLGELILVFPTVSVAERRPWTFKQRPGVPVVLDLLSWSARKRMMALSVSSAESIRFFSLISVCTPIISQKQY